jgi:hypothetical protein
MLLLKRVARRKGRMQGRRDQRDSSNRFDIMNSWNFAQQNQVELVVSRFKMFPPEQSSHGD